MSYPHKDQVYSLAALGLAADDIAAIVGIDIDELELHYSETYRRGLADVRRRIVGTQLELALEERDKSMLIHLGKVVCGQSERSELDVRTEQIHVTNFGDGELKPYEAPSEAHYHGGGVSLDTGGLQPLAKSQQPGAREIDDDTVIGATQWDPNDK